MNANRLVSSKEKGDDNDTKNTSNENDLTITTINETESCVENAGSVCANYGSGLKDQDEHDNEESTEGVDVPASGTAAAVVKTSPLQPQKQSRKMSKNQLKRQQKLERIQSLKKQRKEQYKQKQLEKAKSEGRDVEKEKEEMERRRLDGSGWKKRQERWQQIFENSQNKFQVCLDCCFEEQMSERELASLASQMRYMYASNKRATHPVTVTVTSLIPNSPTDEQLQKLDGVEQWHYRQFFRTANDLLTHYAKHQKSKLVYLTSDSPNTLETLEDDKIYIVGGIVDRNRLKRATIHRATTQLGIAHAKLPIERYLQLTSTKVLTCNHVFDLLVQWRDCQQDWKQTLLKVLPPRKEARAKTTTNEDDVES